MQVSRRRLLTHSALFAAAVPLSLRSDRVDAAPAAQIDFSMGFPPKAVRLDRNENALGTSPLALEGARAGLPGSARYADPIVLRKLLAQHHGIDGDWILVGTGSGELLSLAPLAYARTGNVVSTLESYRALTRYAQALGASVKWVKLRTEGGYAYDVDGLLAAVDAQTRLLFVCTPNNPTGTTLSYAELRRLCDGLPKDVLLVVDEAYIHYQPAGPTGIDLLKAGYGNVLVTRTFSKAYALAGMRVGYGIGHPDIMRKLAMFGCGPTSTNMAGFGAAIASLGDAAHVERSQAHVRSSRAMYAQQARALGLPMVSGSGPFALIEVGEHAEAIQRALVQRNVFVRTAGEWDLSRHLRVSFGLEEENRAFFAALKQVMTCDGCAKQAAAG
jgi:histidinol-phosphate aminotransferase